MSSFRNAIPRRTHKERAQPEARKKFGLLEKHKDYVQRAQAFHKKEETLRKLKEKASFKNPDEFYFKMIKTKVVNGVHRAESEANKFTAEELMLMKTQDIGYVLQKLQSEKKKLEKLKASLHSLDNQPSDRHVYFAEDSEEAEDIKSRPMKNAEVDVHITLPRKIIKKINASYKEVEDKTERVNALESVYVEMALKKELQTYQSMASKLTTCSPYESPHDLELSLRDSFDLHQPKLKPPLKLILLSPLEYSTLNMAISYGLLCEPLLARPYIKHLHAIVNDGYAVFIQLLVQVVDQLYPRITPPC